MVGVRPGRGRSDAIDPRHQVEDFARSRAATEHSAVLLPPAHHFDLRHRPRYRTRVSASLLALAQSVLALTACTGWSKNSNCIGTLSACTRGTEKLADCIKRINSAEFNPLNYRRLQCDGIFIIHTVFGKTTRCNVS